jgi:hypothetical protein
MMKDERRVMSVGEVEMKERILLISTEYSVLKEKMKEHECGWSELYGKLVVRGN